MSEDPTFPSIVLGGGCFWCVETLYQRHQGVRSAQSGYAGGQLPNPTYEQVCGGQTGHAEVVKVVFDPSATNLEALLGFFWEAHDPTTLNRQGEDVGTQYRSVIFYQDETQKRLAEASRAAAAARFSDPIVTTIEPLDTFYPAEAYHEDYFNRNPQVPYCQFVIAPKVAKLSKNHQSLK